MTRIIMKIKSQVFLSLLLILSINLNAQSFETLGGGLRVTGTVYFIEFDTVNNRMFVSGDFTQVENVQCQNIVYHDSSGWHGFGLGTRGFISSMKYVNDRLYVGGSITTIDGFEVENNICYYDSSGWHNMDGGVNGSVYSLEYFNSKLYVSGTFSIAGGIVTNGIAAWDGNAWSSTGPGADYLYVFLKVMDNMLYAYGTFDSFNGIVSQGVVVFDGMNWFSRSLNAAQLTMQNITTCGGQLYASVLNSVTNRTEIRQYNGSAWTPLIINLRSDFLNAMTSHNDTLIIITNYYGSGMDSLYINKYKSNGQLVEVYKSGEANSNISLQCRFAKSINGMLYFGGQFRNFENQFAAGALCISPNGIQVPFHASTGYDDAWYLSYGSGMFFDSTQNKLIVGGRFDFAGDTLANSIATWDGTNWSPMGSGFNCVNEVSVVRRIERYNGQIYAAGLFTKSGNKTVNNIAVWNGADWDTVGTGTNGYIRDMVVYNNTLYIAGLFTTFNGMVNVDGLVKYDGTSWTTISSLTNSGNYAYSMCVHDNKLFVSGFFDFGGIDAQIASFDGISWTAVPSPGPPNDAYHRMLSIGGYLYAGSPDTVYRYDGTTWTIVMATHDNWGSGFSLVPFDTIPIIGDLADNATYMLNSQGQTPMLCLNQLFYSVPIDSISIYVTGFIPTVSPSGHVMNHVGILRRQMPSTQFTYSSDSVCDHEYVSYSAIVSDFTTTYEWTFQGGVPNTSISFTPSIKYSVPGTYDVGFKATNAFGSDSVFFPDLIFVANCTLGLNEYGTNEILTYPNPVTDFLNVQLSPDQQIMQISVYDMLGKKEMDYTISDNSQTAQFLLNFTKMPQGIHFLIIDTMDKRYVSKITKN